VPSSHPPIGSHRLQREVLLPALLPTQRAILHFDAITYHGTVWLNGHRLGEMGPYVPYEFDLTPHAVAGRNSLAVDMVDIAAGPNGEGAA
jgi:beta-galactosidase/beta-glucuronidase